MALRRFGTWGRLGHVLAQLVQGSPTARAGLRARIDDALTRQMVGQGPAGRLTPFERLYLDPARSADLVPGLGLGLILFQLEQAQLQLAQQRAAFRRGADPMPALNASLRDAQNVEKRLKSELANHQDDLRKRLEQCNPAELPLPAER